MIHEPFSKKEVGRYGETAAATYLERKGFRVIDRNVARKTGEIDVIVKKGNTIHFVEVKSVLVDEFPDVRKVRDEYDPSANLHLYKIRKVARTAEWYVAEHDWEGDWQIDGFLAWIRKRDRAVLVRYLPQIV